MVGASLLATLIRAPARSHGIVFYNCGSSLGLVLSMPGICSLLSAA